MVARRHDKGMDTHLTLLNEDVVTERELAMRHAGERAAGRGGAAPISDYAAMTGGHVTPGHGGAHARVEPAGRRARGLDLVVVSLFAVLAAGFVSLVATTIRL